MRHIFLDKHQAVLCYNSKDRRLAQRLMADLKTHSVSVWTGDYLKPSSDYWLTSLHQALDVANSLFVILTPHTKSTAQVQQAIDYAHEKSIPVYLLLASGDATNIRFDSFGKSHLFDIRKRVQSDQSLAVPEILSAAHHPPAKPPNAYLYWNPIDQFRLFFAMFWYPERVRAAQKDHKLTIIKRTGGWLAATMFFAILFIFALEDVIQEPNLRSIFRVALVTIPGIWSGQFYEILTWWNFAINAIVVAVAMMLLLLVTLLLIDLNNVSSGGFTTLTFFITFPLLGGIAGGIAEAFQTHRLAIFFFSLISAFVWGATAISLMTDTVVSGIGTGAGAILILMLLGSLVGIIAIIIVYLLLFLVADSLIRTLYLDKKSTVSRVVPTVGIACYGLLIIAAIF